MLSEKVGDHTLGQCLPLSSASTLPMEWSPECFQRFRRLYLNVTEWTWPCVSHTIRKRRMFGVLPAVGFGVLNRGHWAFPESTFYQLILPTQTFKLC